MLKPLQHQSISGIDKSALVKIEKDMLKCVKQKSQGVKMPLLGTVLLDTHSLVLHQT